MINEMPFESSFLPLDAARTLYAAGDAAHDFDHVWRVTQLACRLAAAEGADVDVVGVAALLHDVPVEAQPGVDATQLRKAHHLAAADFARAYLTDRGMPTIQVDNIVHCIEAHRFRDQSVQPTTVEAKCLYDADKLDSMGAIGVARAFAYAGNDNNRLWTTPWQEVPPIGQKPTGAEYTPVHEYVYKLQRLLDTLYTATARRIGEARHQFMVDFFEQLDREMRQ